MKYAIIKLGNKQVKVTEGQTLEVDKQALPLDISVLMYSNNSKLMVGEPFVEGVSVNATVVDEKRARKLRVARFKSKSRYRKVRGHRTHLNVIKINSISLEGEEKTTANTTESIDKPAKITKSEPKSKTAKTVKPSKKLKKDE